MSSAIISPDGTRIVTTSGWIALVWDAATGARVGEPLQNHDRIINANFSPDGTRIATASMDGTARIWDSVVIANDIPASGFIWEPTGTPNPQGKLPTESAVVIAWVRAIAGLRFKANGELEIIPNDERRAVLDQTKLPPGRWAELAAWLKTSGPERELIPYPEVTLRQVAEVERDLGSRVSLEMALRYDPTVPLARMMLANVLEKEELAKEDGNRDATVLARAAHWRRYDLDRLPDDAKLWARAAEILRQLPEAQVGVGPRPITAAETAKQADQQALQIQSRAR